MLDKRALLGLALSGALLAACGGKVVYESTGAGGAIPSTSGVGGNGGGVGEGGGCVDSCAAAVVDGGIPCPSDAATLAYEALVSCAAASCAVECASLIAGGPADATCGDCFQVNCFQEATDCANN